MITISSLAPLPPFCRLRVSPFRWLAAALARLNSLQIFKQIKPVLYFINLKFQSEKSSTNVTILAQKRASSGGTKFNLFFCPLITCERILKL